MVGEPKNLLQKELFRGTFYPQCGVLQHSLSCGKEGRSWTTSGNQSRELQNVCGILPLRNGRLENSFRPSETRRFHVQTRPKVCTFHHPSPCQVSEIHTLSIRRENVVSHLGYHQPLALSHQGTPTNCEHAREHGCPDDTLFGRYAPYRVTGKTS